MSNEICNTCGQQIPEGYMPVQTSGALVRAIKVFAGADDEDGPVELFNTPLRFETTPENYPTWTEEGQEIPGVLGRVKLIEDFGGMDQGSTRYLVLQVSAPSGPRYVMIPGYYQSHHGSDWYVDQTHEVFPKMVEVREWEAK